MSAAEIFISHTIADDTIVAEIRKALEGLNLPVWVDSRGLSGGDDMLIRILMVVCQPGADDDVSFGSVASRLIKALSEDLRDYVVFFDDHRRYGCRRLDPVCSTRRADGPRERALQRAVCVELAFFDGRVHSIYDDGPVW